MYVYQYHVVPYLLYLAGINWVSCKTDYWDMCFWNQVPPNVKPTKGVIWMIWFENHLKFSWNRDQGTAPDLDLTV